MRRPLTFVAILSCTCATAAHAQTTSLDPVAAESLFNEGRVLLEEGKLAEACQRFERSQQLDPAVGTLLNLGDCYERRHALADAWVTYRQAAALANTRQDEGRSKVAQAEAARIEPRLAYIALTVATAGDAPSVTRDGVKVDPAVFGVSVPVDPGEHSFEARAPGRLTWSRRITFVEGEHKTLTVPLLDRDPMTDEAPSPPSAPPPRVEKSSTQRSIGIGLELGGGAVLLRGPRLWRPGDVHMGLGGSGVSVGSMRECRRQAAARSRRG